MPDLSSARIKLQRAHEYLALFDSELRSFLEREPYKLIPNGYGESGDYRFTVRISEKPSFRLPLYAGGFSHYLRCVIEHTAWQLSLLTTDNPVGRTAFPVFLDPERYKKEGLPKIQDVFGDAKPIIEELQPYQTGLGTSHPLWTIMIFSDVDKHRDLAIVQTSIRIHFAVGEGFRSGLLFNSNPPLYDGQDISIGISLDNIPNDQMDLKIDPVFSIVAEKRSGSEMLRALISVDGLMPIYEFVRDNFLPRFDGFF